MLREVNRAFYEFVLPSHARPPRIFFTSFLRQDVTRRMYKTCRLRGCRAKFRAGFDDCRA